MMEASSVGRTMLLLAESAWSGRLLPASRSCSHLQVQEASPVWSTAIRAFSLGSRSRESPSAFICTSSGSIS